MVVKYYVGHEVIKRVRFVKFMYDSNSRSCHSSNYYYVSRKCVLLLKNPNGGYIYANNRNKCTVIDPNDLEAISTTLACHQCEKGKNGGIDCDLKVDNNDELIGVVDIQPIESFTRTSNLVIAINLVREYNSSINSDEEFVYVDDLRYIDTIRNIDDDIGKTKVRTLK